MQKFLWFVVLCGVGSVFVMIPLALGGLEFLIHFGITYVSRLQEGGTIWPEWQKPTTPNFLRVRLFNITNPKDFINSRAKPILQEVGPYVYREALEKFDVTQNQYEDTIRYRQVHNYYFEPKMSRGKESDLINIINFAFVGFAKIANGITDSESLLESWDRMLAKRGEKLIRLQSVKEILFDGFGVKAYLELAKDPSVQAVGNITFPAKMMNGRLGIFEGKNGTDDGWLEVRTGTRESADLGRVVSWNGAPTLTKWRGEPCNSIRGTDGLIFQPFLTPTTKIEAFVPDLCRTLSFDFDKNMDHNGILTYRFTPPASQYSKTSKNKDNWCYCANDDEIMCPPEGMIRLTNCYDGAPLLMSMPHFLFVDDRTRKKVSGLSPDIEKHQTFFDLHPMTGIFVEVKQKFQYSIEIQPWNGMPTFKNAPTLILPIVWAEEGGDLDDTNKTLLKLLDFGLKLWGFGKWVAIIFWILVTGGALALIMYNRKNSRVELIDENEDDDE